MTTAPIQRVGLHELTQLLDGDVVCSIPDCGSPATTATTHGTACTFPLCDGCAHAVRSQVAAAVITSTTFECRECHTSGIPASVITFRPI